VDLTRRRLLSFVPATALLTAVNPAPAAHATRGAMTADPSQLLANAIAIYAGTPASCSPASRSAPAIRT